MDKEKLRKDKRVFRKSLTQEQVVEKSKKIEKRLMTLPEFISAKTILFYYSIRNEVSTIDMITKSLKMGKEVALPGTRHESCLIIPRSILDLSENIEIGRYGLKEPIKDCTEEVKKERLDCVIVPGLVFDTHGARIGMGKGFYDRFLKRLRKDQITIGLAYDEQVVDTIKTDSHDVHMNVIVTDKRVLRISHPKRTTRSQ